ncbi:hypothetical protein [Metabacillus iocasae]|uniref:Uncharacterized protein n=1 Tax=Priestia iocasae TaxID=2291674 RepID=A0ABS2QV97_9BACI|nr:hypothetical protein [Metabacillus iocasae]MBM7702867.1 hypothetical protein [Metabacillus iocasae]
MVLLSLFKPKKKDCCQIEIIEMKEAEGTCCVEDEKKQESDKA